MSVATAAAGAARPIEGGWDCHAHLFGPYDRFPLAALRNQTPPEATEAAYQAVLDRLGLGHGVLVHPSAYGDDHALLRHALSRHPHWRGVMVPAAGTTPSFAGWHAQGVRGARFSHRPGLDFPGSARLNDLEANAAALADAGLHAELWTNVAALADIAPRLAGLPVPVVVDHMGGFDVAAGVDDPGFRALCTLLGSGRVWVKLCAYRNTGGRVDDAALPFHRALVAANPQQLVWGSDWPHLRVDPTPDPLALLQALRAWCADDALERAILVDNPARLYG